MDKKYVILRDKEILRLCNKKKVLDLGCIAHTAKCEKTNYWLHKRIKSVAKEITGIDYEKKEIKKLNAIGYNIKYGDVERLDLKEKFEVIVAGELIEHLYNPGLFLDSMKKHMDKDTILIITTPNCFSMRRVFGSLFIRKFDENPEHVSYYSNVILKQLFERKGFKVVAEKYYMSEDKKNKFYPLEKFLSFFLHKENSHGLFFVFKLK